MTPMRLFAVRPTGTTPVPSRRLLAAAAAACALAAGCASGSERLEVRELVRRGEYARAVAVGEKRASEAPGDQARQADLELARLAHALEQGRRASLAGNEPVALGWFEQALAIAPDSPTAQQWHNRSLSLLADAAKARAKEAEASGRLEDAFEDYLEADRLWPSDPTSRAGAARMLLLMNHKEGLGDVYYLNGLRSLHALSLPEAQQQFASASKHRPDDPRTQDRIEEVAVLMADERVAVGRELQEEGLYRAARNEYRLALLYAPEHEVAKEAMALAEQEVAVLDLLDEAARLQQRGEFAMASARLDRAASLTELQAESVEAARRELVDQRRRELYRRAREYETDYRFPEAIELYTELIDETGFYDDAIARRDTLRSYVETAERLYREAQGATDPAVRRDLLRQIQLFWPDYRDVRQLLEQ